MSENNVKSYYKEFYKTQVVTNLKQTNNFKNIMSIPKVEKITLNMGVGIRDSKILEMALKDMEEIAAQKPVVTKSRKSIANFKLREGMKLGVKVTLRGDNMYNFLQRLIFVAMPQVQDFMGLSEKSFDGRGNYSLGIKDILAFGIEFKNNDSYHTGLDISITTSAVNDEGALLLLRELGFPFKQKRNKI